jgi:arylsulfatase A-like enzyme
MMTTQDSRPHSPISPSPIKVGIVVGLLGGALVALGESIGVLIEGLRPPTLLPFHEIATLVAGLAFLAALTSAGAACVLAPLGGIVALWQRVRRVRLAPFGVASLLGTIFAAGYTALRTADRLGIKELIESREHALGWVLLLISLAAAAGAATWVLLSSLLSRWHRDQGSHRLALRWSIARNLSAVVLLILCISPLLFAAARQMHGLRLLSAAKVHAAPPSASGQPNIVLVTIDALRADHLGVYGYAQARTPNIDAFAAQGVVFEQATSQAPWTFPSFASLFTSMYPSELNISIGNKHISEMYKERVDDARATLAEVLQASGYHTQAIVTNPWLKPEFGFAQGFEGYLSVDEPHVYHLELLHNLTVVQIARKIPPLYEKLSAAYTWITGNPGELQAWDVRADRVTQEAIAWLRSEHSTPFFLWVHYIDPHYPFDPPQDYRPSPAGVTPERLDYLSSYNEEEIYTGRARLRPEDKAAMVALYDGEIAYTDYYVGRLLGEIDALGLRDNSIVVLSADHGDEFWDHGGYQHGHSLYSELIHVPLIIRGPGVLSEPRHIEAGVQQLDLMPTLLDFIGRQPPAEAQGRSLLPLLSAAGPVADPDPYRFAEGLFLGEEQKTIRDNGYTLIYRPFSNTFELYDLAQDPGEQYNLAASNPAMVESLYKDLKDWLLAARERGAALPRANTQDQVDAGAIERLRSGGY